MQDSHYPAERLRRPLLLPEAERFDEVLQYLGEWNDDATDKRPTMVDGNAVGPYCTIDLTQIGGERWRSISARPSQAARSALVGRIVTPDDRLSFKLIAHRQSGRVLVVCEHGYIIGSHWLAYIDPTTIPGEGRRSA